MELLRSRKKVGKAFLAVLYLLATAATATALQFGYFTYATNNGTITITDYSGSETAVIIPSNIDGKPVTSIGSYAFNECYYMTSITIPDSVTAIGDFAFQYCSHLTSVTIPDSVTSIGEFGFFYCSRMTSILADSNNPVYCSVDGVLFNKNQTTIIKYPSGKSGNYIIPSDVTSIGNYAFHACLGITSVTIPSNVTSIGKGAFSDCTQITSITISDGVTAIGDYAFYSCRTDNVTIPESITTIGYCAFLSSSRLTAILVDPDNPAYSSVNGVLFNKNQTMLIQYPSEKDGSYTIPDSVNTIDGYAFYACLGLSDITIPDGVTTIGERAFSECYMLTSVTFPDSVTTIGDHAFHNCRPTSITIPASVTSIGYCAVTYCGILVDTNNPAYSSADGVLFNKDQTTIIQCPEGKPGSYTIPDSVTSIGNYAFSHCNALDSVTIPSSVTNIGDYAFSDCALNLTSITIPDGVATIGSYAFYNSRLDSVTIPDSVTLIGDRAFGFCRYLAAFFVDSNNPAYSSVDGFLLNKNQTMLIQHPIGNAGNCTIPDSVTTIVDYAFHYCLPMTSITIPDSVISIGSRVFSDCINLESIYFMGDAPPGWGLDVFYGDRNITVYYMPETTDWGTIFGGFSTMLWNPQAQNFDVTMNQFGFTVTGSSNLVIAVETCTNLANPVWIPAGTCTLTGGSAQFSDPQSSNYPASYYRFSAP